MAAVMENPIINSGKYQNEMTEPQNSTTSNLFKLRISENPILPSKCLAQSPLSGCGGGLKYHGLDTTSEGQPSSGLNNNTGYMPTCSEYSESWLSNTDASSQGISSSNQYSSENEIVLPLHPLVQPVTTSDTHHTAHPIDQKPIHPLQLDTELRPSFSSCPIPSSLDSASTNNKNQTWQQQQHQQQQTTPTHPLMNIHHHQQQQHQHQQYQQYHQHHQHIVLNPPPAQGVTRKRTLLVSRIRKVFNKPSSSSFSKELQEIPEITEPHQQPLEDIISLSSNLSHVEAPEHRGSVSSSSSGETMSVGQTEFSTNTPLTSPEISPTGSPRLKHNTPEIPGFRNFTDPQVNASLPGTGRPLLDNVSAPSPAAKSIEKRMSVDLTPSRTVKKRLSFASITSFFNPKGSDAAAERKKQHRSSSVPNVETPLSVVTRQIAPFQRRHSLGDLPEISEPSKMPQRWEKDNVSTQATTASGADVSIASSKTTSEKVGDSFKRSKIYGVFGKKKSKQVDESSMTDATDSSVTVNPHPPKPLRSALTQRQQRSPSVSRSSTHRLSLYEQGQQSQQSQQQFQQSSQPPIPPMPVRRQSYPGPLINLSEDQPQQQPRLGERMVGPTRHRRQSSIASRQATQPGYYPAVEKKRLSIRYSNESERDSIYFVDPSNPAYQAGGFVVQHPEYEMMGMSQPVATPISAAMQSSVHDHAYNPMPTISPLSSRQSSYTSIAQADGSQFSPHLLGTNNETHAFNIQETPRPTMNRRSSYHQGDSLGGGIVFSQNNRRNSVVSISPSVHSIHMDPLGPVATAMGSISPSPSIQRSVASSFSPVSPVSAMISGHQQFLQQQQQQQQFQLHQQMQAQHQQFQRAQQQQQQQQQQFLQQQQFQQQFMNPISRSHPSQQPSLQDSYGYSHPYHFNVQQPIPSHLFYTQQHPLQYHPQQQQQQHQQQQYASSMGNNANNMQYGSMHFQNPSTTSRTPSPPTTSSSSSSPTCIKSASSKQIQFSTAQPIIHQTWAPDQYDRTSDPNITAHRLTQPIAQKIKLELNQFKSQEMIVHQDSRVYTHFFV